jgi:pimeloyl-ACP methyl ester carboxylesterase
LAADAAVFGWLLAFQAQQFRRNAPPALARCAQEALEPFIAGQFAAQPSALPAFAKLTRDLPASLETNGRRAAQLASFPAPVGLVWGAGDPYMNQGVAEHLQSLFPAADLTLLPVGHWPQIDAPEQVAQGLLTVPTVH